MRKKWLWNCGLFILTILVLTACQKVTSPKPNILFIMTDQQPLSCVGAYGNDQIATPNIDRLAQEGSLLQNFYIAAFPCSPSRASFLSGRYLHNHNVFTNNVKMDESIPTLGQILSEANYHTGYFGKAHLSGAMYVGRQSGGDGIDYMHTIEPDDPVGEDITEYWHHERREGESGWITQKVDGGLGEDFPQLGFQEWAGGWRQYKDWLSDHGQDEFARTAGNHDALQSAPEGQHMYSKLGEKYHMAAFFTEQTEQFVRKHSKSEKPWAAVLSYFGPHLPVSPPQPWDTLYALQDIPLPANLQDNLIGKPKAQRKTELQYVLGQWTNDQYKDYIRRYWGYSGYIDAKIGEILRVLQETGQWENTIVIFTTDHGDMVGGHGMIFKLGSNGYEELFHVPAIIRIPALDQRGTKIESLVSSIDLLPTILEAAEIDLPEKIDGKSLIPILNQPDQKHREAIFSEIHSTSNEGKVIICRSDNFKYVYHWMSQDVDELYNLEVDPGELKNLYVDETYQTMVEEMRRLIIDWAQSTGHRYADLIARKAE